MRDVNHYSSKQVTENNLSSVVIPHSANTVGEEAENRTCGAEYRPVGNPSPHRTVFRPLLGARIIIMITIDTVFV